MSELNTETNEAAASGAAKAFGTAAKRTRPGARKPRVAASGAKAARRATAVKNAPKAAPRATAKPKATQPGKAAREKGLRATSKTETILGLVKRAGGASLNEIMKATGWQAHSVRGFLSATLGRKRKLTIVSIRTGDGERRYSIQA
jgi:hypothetical protein